MGLLLRIPGVSFTDAAIPILYNDPVANAGTLDIFDALDADISWPPQANPTEGSDLWKSLLGATPNTASFAGTIGFSGGFTFDDTADIITLPNTFRRGASESGVVIFWTKVGTQAFTTGNGVIAWTGDNAAGCQFLCYLDHNTTDANTYLSMFDANATQQIMAQPLSVLPASKIAQIGVSFEPEGGGYRIKSFLNGAQVGSYLRGALATLPQPTASMRVGGTLSGYTNAYTGTFLRGLDADWSVMTPAALVALDFATHVDRLAA